MKDANYTAKELIDFHFQSNQGMYFSEYIKKKGYVVLFSNLIQDYYWNFISDISSDFEEIYKEAKTLFEAKNRNIAIYLTPSSSVSETTLEVNFEKAGTDAWMVLEDPQILNKYSPQFDIQTKTISINDRDDYLKTFERAYGSSDPNDPYGNLPKEYTDSLYNSFVNENKKFKKVYASSYINKNMISVGCMFIKDNIAGIYGVGTIAEQRKKGAATALMAYFYNIALKEKVSTIMLQTEYGSYNELLYKKMGFSTIFMCSYHVEKQNK